VIPKLGPTVTTSDPHFRGAGLADLCITWAPPGARPNLSASEIAGPIAVFEATDRSGLAIVRPGSGGLAYSGETGTYRHWRTEPPDTEGIFGNAPYLLAVRLYVPESYRDEVRRWLDEEHIAQQLGVSGAFWYQGYEASSGRFAFLNLWGLRDPGVIQTPEWTAARDSAWRQRLLPAFHETDRAVYRRLVEQTPRPVEEADW